jgi:hypothetical protein
MWVPFCYLLLGEHFVDGRLEAVEKGLHAWLVAIFSESL